jgi:hypothetical protein
MSDIVILMLGVAIGWGSIGVYFWTRYRGGER